MVTENFGDLLNRIPGRHGSAAQSSKSLDERLCAAGSH